NENTEVLRGLTREGTLPQPVDAVMRGADAGSWRARGRMDLQAQAYSTAYASFRRAVALDSRDAEALKGVSDSAGGAGRPKDEREWVGRLPRAEPATPAVRVELSRVRAAAHAYDGAVSAATEARRLAPDDPRPIEQLASVLADMNDAQRLEPLADTL